MRICKVIGSVTAQVKHSAYEKLPLMIVQPLDAKQQELGASLLAVDTVQSGPGDCVLVMSEGSGVRQILKTNATSSPIRSVIVGIVDAIDVAEDET